MLRCLPLLSTWLACQGSPTVPPGSTEPFVPTQTTAATGDTGPHPFTTVDDTPPVQVLLGEGAYQWGSAGAIGMLNISDRGVFPAGDVDGDGDEELWVRACVADEFTYYGYPLVGCAEALTWYLLEGGPTAGGTLPDVAPVRIVPTGSPNTAVVAGLDMNGDALSDVGVVDSSRAYVHLAPLQSPLVADDAAVLLEGFEYLSRGSVRAGDLDADGATDLAVAEPARKVGPTSYAGAIHLFDGPIATPQDVRDATDARARLVGEQVYDHVGAPTLLGDLDGDGIDELVLGGLDAVLVVPSDIIGETPVRDVTYAEIRGSGSEQHAQLLDMDDLDGDGALDLLVLDDCGDSRTCAWVVPGSVAGEVRAAATALGGWDRPTPIEGGGPLRFGAAPGDVTGDGTPDVLLSLPSHSCAGSRDGAVFLVPGPPGGMQGVAAAAAAMLCGGSDTVASGGVDSLGGADLDGDGWSDIYVGDWHYRDRVGRVSAVDGAWLATRL